MIVCVSSSSFSVGVGPRLSLGKLGSLILVEKENLFSFCVVMVVKRKEER